MTVKMRAKARRAMRMVVRELNAGKRELAGLDCACMTGASLVSGVVLFA
jgi:hypothetical protein